MHALFQCTRHASITVVHAIYKLSVRGPQAPGVLRNKQYSERTTHQPVPQSWENTTQTCNTTNACAERVVTTAEGQVGGK